jgi:hypothetical protein
MTDIRVAILAALAALGLGPGTASAQDQPTAYRGMFVCEKVPGAADILHVPIDLVVRGENVQFARPLFNLAGTRVTGSELGDGTIGADGKVHLTSEWQVRGIAVQGDYSGTLSPSGGTLSGTQSWHNPEGEARSRSCHVALVPVAAERHAAWQQKR